MTKYRPGVPSADDWTQVKIILRTGALRRKQKKRNFKDFLRQCRRGNISPEARPEKALALYVTMMRKSNLKPGTMKNYLRNVLAMYNVVFPNCLPRNKKVMALGYVDLLCARHPAKHATDFPEEALLHMIRLAFQHFDAEIAWRLYLMIQVGLRCEDAAKLKRRQVDVDDAGVSLELRITKTFALHKVVSRCSCLDVC